MTISVLDTKETFTGTGALTRFSFGFAVSVDTDLRVFYTAVDGAETDLVLDTDYTVTLNLNQGSNPGGFIDFTVAPDVGVPGVIMRNLDFARGASFVNSVAPHIIEAELDRLTMYAQQLGEVLDRSLHVSPAQQEQPLVRYGNAQLRAGTVVGFDDEGQAALYGFAGGSLVGPAGPALASRVELSAPAVFIQGSDQEWSHLTVTATFIWSSNGAPVETREVEIELDELTSEFVDPDLTEPGDEFTSTLVDGTLLQLTSEFNGQREYAEFVVLTIPSDESFISASFEPTWGAGEFTGGDPAGEVSIVNRAGVVAMTLEAALVAVSDDGAMTWDAATVPAAYRPLFARTVQCVLQYDDATEVQGSVTVNPDGSAVFTVNEVAATLVTPGGEFQTGEDKGLPAHWNVLYPI